MMSTATTRSAPRRSSSNAAPPFVVPTSIAVAPVRSLGMSARPSTSSQYALVLVANLASSVGVSSSRFSIRLVAPTDVDLARAAELMTEATEHRPRLVDAVLVGENLLRQQDVGMDVRDLMTAVWASS